MKTQAEHAREYRKRRAAKLEKLDSYENALRKVAAAGLGPFSEMAERVLSDADHTHRERTLKATQLGH